MKYKQILPNVLSSLRLFTIPLIVFFRPEYRFAILLFIALSDFFDGYLARRWSVVSSFGAIVDPIADKAVAATFSAVCLFEGFVSPINFVLFFSRDIAELIFGFLVLFTSFKTPPGPFWSGKVATTFQAVIAGFWCFQVPAPQFLFILVLFSGISSLVELIVKQFVCHKPSSSS